MASPEPPADLKNMRTGFRSTAVAVIAYAVAMGFLEATVVAYLAAALGQDVPFLPFAAPAQPLSTFLAIFRLQYSTLLVGIGRLQTGHPCQKHPFTKMALRRALNSIRCR